jgi:hypothetical protein
MKKQRETIGSDNTEVVYSLLGIIADIRQKTGVGDKVMLGELADALGALMQNGKSAIYTNQVMGKKLQEMDDLLRQCAIIVESQARQDWGQQKLLAGFRPCEPDSPAIQLWEALREKGYSIWK